MDNLGVRVSLRVRVTRRVHRLWRLRYPLTLNRVPAHSLLKHQEDMMPDKTCWWCIGAGLGGLTAAIQAAGSRNMIAPCGTG